jgi:hypothetical protein
MIWGRVGCVSDACINITCCIQAKARRFMQYPQANLGTDQREHRSQSCGGYCESCRFSCATAMRDFRSKWLLARHSSGRKLHILTIGGVCGGNGYLLFSILQLHV